LLNACFENKPMKEPALPIMYMFFFFFPLGQIFFQKRS